MVIMNNFKGFNHIYKYFITIIIVLISYCQIFLIEGKVSIGDANIIFQRYEALRQTILNYHQWPGINIWNGAGQPLEGLAYIFPLSIKSLLTLLFGVENGFSISMLIYLALSIYGSYKLSNFFKWDMSSFIFYLSPVLLILNLPLAFHLKSGHLIFTTYLLIPLLLFYFLNRCNDYYSGLKFGILFSFACYDSPHYVLHFFALLIFFIFIFDLIRLRLISFRFLALSTTTFLFLNTYQLIQIYDVISEFRRLSDLNFHYSFITILKSYFIPYITVSNEFPGIPGIDSGSCVRSTHEISTYIGPLAFILLIIGYNNKYIMWYFLLFAFFLIGIGNDSFLYPMYWIKSIPTFDSLLCFSRARIITYLLFNICLIFSINNLFTKYSKKYASLFLATILIERFILIFLVLNNSFLDPSKVDSFYKIAENTRGNFGSFINYSALSPFEGTKLNVGILRGGGDSNLPLVRVTPNPSEIQVFGFDEKGYEGEFFQQNNVVSVTYWSPNHIQLDNVLPSVPLNINLYPSKNWLINGERINTNSIYDTSSRIQILPSSKSIDMEYKPIYRMLGLWLTLVFFLLFLFTLFFYAYKRNR